MGENSAIEWTDATWNPVTIGSACKNDYAERLAVRLRAMGNSRYRNGFRAVLQPDVQTLSLRWREPKRIFVNSMSDLFHEAVPDDFIQQLFEVMKRADRHIFQILTKRTDRLASLANRLIWMSKLWQGVFSESGSYIRRIGDSGTVPAGVYFLSIELLLGSSPNWPPNGIPWVIVGGEIGPPGGFIVRHRSGGAGTGADSSAHR